jgi:hypothetical protein
MNSKSNKLPACICRIALAFVFAVLFAFSAYAANVTIGWDPNEEPDLEGYKVYRNLGSPGPPYNNRTTLPEANLADPLNPLVTLTGLEENQKYFLAVTAYDTDGNESRYSDDVCVQVVDSAITMCSSSAGAGSGRDGGGGGGAGCFIAAVALQTTLAIAGPFFPSQPADTPFAVVFMLLILFFYAAGVARAVLLKAKGKIKQASGFKFKVHGC